MGFGPAHHGVAQCLQPLLQRRVRLGRVGGRVAGVAQSGEQAAAVGPLR